jgi:PhnB protein
LTDVAPTAPTPNPIFTKGSFFKLAARELLWRLPSKEKTMTKQVKAIPDGYHSVTPYLMIQGAAKAIEFYKRAFGAEEIMHMDGPDGKITHAEIKIGDSRIMLSDEMSGAACRSPQSLGGSTASVFVYLENVDSVFDQAVKAGAKVVMAPSDQPWGDRFSTVTDPFGHVWSLATHVEDVTPEEMSRRMQEMMAQRAKAAS